MIGGKKKFRSCFLSMTEIVRNLLLYTEEGDDLKNQLKSFHLFLLRYGLSQDEKMPKDWFDVFYLLKKTFG